MITIVVVGGIRTHYIKIHAMQKTIASLDSSLQSKFEIIYVDAGQHYSIPLNGFIDELNICFDYRLKHDTTSPYGIATSIISQLGDLFDSLQKVKRIDYVLVMGDVMTTIAAALSATLKGINVIHVESGARVKKGIGGEEYYRTATDHMSSLCFASTQRDLANLVKEGLADHSFFVGDVLYDYLKTVPTGLSDSFHYFRNGCLKEFCCNRHDYVLSSLHHVENLSPQYLSLFFEVLHDKLENVIFIAHPRVSRILAQYNINTFDVTIAEYIPYKENLIAIANSSFIITDSGGMQREAFYLNKHCIVRSDMNIWMDLVNNGNSIIAGNTESDLVNSIAWAKQNQNIIVSYDNCFGKGNAVERMLEIISEQ